MDVERNEKRWWYIVIGRSPQEGDWERSDPTALDALTAPEGKGRKQDWALRKVKLLCSVSLGGPRLGIVLQSCLKLPWDDQAFRYTCFLVIACEYPQEEGWAWVEHLFAAKTVPEGAESRKLSTVSTHSSWGSKIFLEVRVGCSLSLYHKCRWKDNGRILGASMTYLYRATLMYLTYMGWSGTPQ